MKRIISFFACALFAAMGLAQVPAWDTSMYQGFGTNQINVTSMSRFNYLLYAGAGENGFAGTSHLYWSPGSTTWILSNDYETARDTMDEGLHALKEYGTVMFMGSKNYSNGAKFYSTDGTTCTQFSQPSFTTTPTYFYERISDIEVFPGLGGSTDTIYVAYDNSNYGAEIWKTPANNPGVWTLALELPDSIYFVNDMQVYNGKLYATTSQAVLYETSDGINWSVNASSNDGFGDQNIYEFRGLGQHAGKLFMGSFNYSGGQIFSTSDGITWDTATIDNSNLSPNAVYDIGNFESYNGNLWVGTAGDYFSALRTTQNTLGGSIGPIVLRSTDNGLNFHRMSGNNIDGDFSASGYYFIKHYNNMMYAGGARTSGGGTIFTLCQSPQVSITEGMVYDTTCVGVIVTFNANTLGAINHDWYLDNVYQTSSPSTGITMTTAGTSVVKVISDNFGCLDSATFSVVVNPAPVIDSLNGQGLSYCENTDATLSVALTNGTAPFQWQWQDFQTSMTDTTQTIVYTMGPNQLAVAVSDKYGCFASYNVPLINVLSSTDLGGDITYTGGNVIDGTAFLIKQGITSNGYDTVTTVALTSAQPNYKFAGLTAGNYLVRIEANVATYPNLINTYYGNHYLWDSALLVPHGCIVNTSADIVMQEIVPPSGPGNLSGTVFEGAGFGLKLAQGPGNPTPFANVIPGVPVKVGKNPGGSIVASGVTDANGEYNFTNLPLDNYKIYTDIPGYPMDSSYSVVLDATNPSALYLNYYVDSNSVFIDTLTSFVYVHAKNEISNLNVFPNPSKDHVNLSFALEENAAVNVELYNLQGQKIAVLLSRNFDKGAYTHTINLNQFSLTSGTYTMRIIMNNNNSFVKLVVIK